MSEERPQHWIELLRYPVLATSVVVALVVLRWVFHLEFGMVTELSTQGIKFSEQNRATLEAISTLESKLNESMARLAALESRGAAPPSAAAAASVEGSAFVAAQTVSDATAKIARLQESNAPAAQQASRGYIWIGNYDTHWEKPQLVRPDTGQPVELPPQAIAPGTEYTVLGNSVLRDGLPANDADYYRGRANLGVLPRGSRVTVVSAPVGIDREYAKQYWAEVELVRDDARRR